jgi:hypothetical protein
MLEEHLAIGWEYDAEVVIDAPADTVARCLPRALGRLEPLDAQTSRLAGSTSTRPHPARAQDDHMKVAGRASLTAA